MALLYRAIWEEDRSDLVMLAEEAVLAWVQSKGVRIDSLAEGETATTAEYGRPQKRQEAPAELLVQRAESEGVVATRVRLTEERPSEGERWTSTLTVLADAGGTPGGTLWVDLERVSDDPFERAPFRAPRLVRQLVRDGIQPRVGHVRLSDEPIALIAGPLAGLVKNEERRLPLAVFSHDDAGSDVTMERARAAQSRLAGVALVVVLGPGEISEFKERVGDELAVWGGAARLYLPNRGASGLRPDRHRYVPAYRMRYAVEAAAEQFVALLAATVPATPPPQSFDLVRRSLTLGTPTTDDTELLELALSDNEQLTKESTRLRDEIADRDDQIDGLRADFEDLQVQLNRQAGVYEQLMAARSGAPVRSDLPNEVESIAEALLWADELEHVVIHLEAPQDIDKLDQTVTARAWANTLWQGLRALDAYGANTEEIAGGFWAWCLGTTSPWAWPATPKKLAMTESESVRNNRKLRGARFLPVSTAVVDSGRVEMFSHLKIAEGGGMLAPRVYFYDDSRGKTGKVHVGFVGPHEHMPNTRTN